MIQVRSHLYLEQQSNRQMFLRLRIKRLPFGAIGLLCCLALSPAAIAQEITLGVLTGVSLSDDFRPTSTTYFGLATQNTSNASQWFMVGPTIELRLPKHFSVEADAIHRTIRIKDTLVFGNVQQPSGPTVSLGPFKRDVFVWQLSVLGKYRIAARNWKPFVEAGPSFLPQENRDQTGITIGSGAELSLWRLKVAPTFRYTRWVNNQNTGGVSDKFEFLVGTYTPSESMQPKAFGRPMSVGIVSGMSLTKLLQDRHDFDLATTVSSDQNTLVAGFMIEVPLFKRLFAETDVLYRPAHEIDGRTLPDGSVQNGPRAAFLTWEIPVLAKYKTFSRFGPLLEIGPAFRLIAHANSENYSHHGVTAGAGISTPIAALNVAPTIRYTHWGKDKRPLGVQPLVATRQNQLELVFVFSF